MARPTQRKALWASELSGRVAHVAESISWQRVRIYAVITGAHRRVRLTIVILAAAPPIDSSQHLPRCVWNLVGHSWHAEIPVMIVSDLLARLMPRWSTATEQTKWNRVFTVGHSDHSGFLAKIYGPGFKDSPRTRASTILSKVGISTNMLEMMLNFSYLSCKTV